MKDRRGWESVCGEGGEAIVGAAQKAEGISTRGLWLGRQKEGKGAHQR